VQKFIKPLSVIGVLCVPVVCGTGCSSQTAQDASTQMSQVEQEKQASAQQVQRDPRLSPQRKEEILRGMKISGGRASAPGVPATNKNP
jgi:hypothetical protein